MKTIVIFLIFISTIFINIFAIAENNPSMDKLKKMSIEELVDLYIKQSNLHYEDEEIILLNVLNEKLINNPKKYEYVERNISYTWDGYDEGTLIDMFQFINGKQEKEIIDNVYQLANKYKICKEVKKYFFMKRYLTYFLCGKEPYNLSIYIFYNYSIKMLDDEYFWRYGLWALYDQDISTTSVVDKKSFKLVLSKGKSIKIFNGHGKSKELYYKNSRIKSLNIYSIGGKNILKTITLDDSYGWKTLEYPSDLKEKEIIFKIKDIYNGTKYNDLCVSEIFEDGLTNNGKYSEISLYIIEKLKQLAVK